MRPHDPSRNPIIAVLLVRPGESSETTFPAMQQLLTLLLTTLLTTLLTLLLTTLLTTPLTTLLTAPLMTLLTLLTT